MWLTHALLHIKYLTFSQFIIAGRSGSFRGLPRPRSAVFSTRVRTSSDTTHLTRTSSQTSLPLETSIQTQTSSGISIRPSSKSSLLFSPRHSQVSASTPEIIQSSEICATSSTSMSSLSMTSLSMFYLEIAEPEIETKHKEEPVCVATMADSSSQSFCSSEFNICSSLPEADYNSSTRNAQAPPPYINIATLKNKRSKKKKTWDKILKAKSFCSESHVTLRQKILRKQHFEAKVATKCPLYSPCTELKKGIKIKWSHSINFTIFKLHYITIPQNKTTHWPTEHPQYQTFPDYWQTDEHSNKHDPVVQTLTWSECFTHIPARTITLGRGTGQVPGLGDEWRLKTPFYLIDSVRISAGITCTFVLCDSVRSHSCSI